MPDSARTPITVILLNWNGWKETIVGLDALFNHDYHDFSLVLLDNGSADDSLDQLQRWFAGRDIMLTIGQEKKFVDAGCIVYATGKNITILRNAANEGFTGGNNKAIAFALEKYEPEYIFLLNNDAILEKGCLAACFDLARKNNAAIVGALVKGMDRQSLVFSGANPVREMFFSTPPKPESSLPEVWETGRVEASGELVETAFLREHFQKRGYYLDPRFFIYCEETDLAFSARDLGRKIFMSKQAVIYHGVAQSMGGGGNPMQYYYSTRNRIFLAQRWLSPLKRFLFHCYFIPTRMARMLQRRIAGKNDVATAIREGLVDGYYRRGGQWKHHWHKP